MTHEYLADDEESGGPENTETLPNAWDIPVHLDPDGLEPMNQSLLIDEADPQHVSGETPDKETN